MTKNFNQLAQGERNLEAQRLRIGRTALQLMSQTHPDMHSELMSAFGRKGSAHFLTGYAQYLRSTPITALAKGNADQVKSLIGAVVYGVYL